MKEWFVENKTPLAHAIIVLCILGTAVITIMSVGHFSQSDLRGLLLFAVLVCCVLIAKSVFDNSRETIALNKLDESLRENDSFTSKALYLELYRNSPVPYMVIDHTGHVHSANLSACRILGVSKQEVMNVQIFDAVKCEPVEHIDLLQERFRNGIAFSEEKVQILRADNEERWALMSLFPISHIPGNNIGLLTLVDITKQKKIEDAKTQFVSLASHQLRTPIAGMKWSAELLQMDNPENFSDRQKKYIDRLLFSVRRMAVLVDDFLRVSRFELGTFVAEYNQFDVKQLFEEVLLEQSARVEQKNLKVKTFYDPEVTTMLSDKNLVRMIVTNLFSNAVKYTRNEGTIHLGYKKNLDSINISVVDNGMGIPAEDHDRIFSKLFRAKNAVRDIPDGTGLGLYIVKEAVEVLKGNISFTSVENQGTTFEVVLPLE
jgi:PAS domain S-box-containing protein